MTTWNFPEYFKTCLLILKMACSCQNRYAYTHMHIITYQSTSSIHWSIVAFRYISTMSSSSSPSYIPGSVMDVLFKVGLAPGSWLQPRPQTSSWHIIPAWLLQSFNVHCAASTVRWHRCFSLARLTHCWSSVESATVHSFLPWCNACCREMQQNLHVVLTHLPLHS